MKGRHLILPAVCVAALGLWRITATRTPQRAATEAFDVPARAVPPVAVARPAGMTEQVAGRTTAVAPTALSPADSNAVRDAPSVVFNGVAYATEPPGEMGERLHAFRAGLAPTNSALALVALDQVPDGAARDDLRGRGVDLLAYVPDRGWIARLRAPATDETEPARAWATSRVTFFRPFDAAMRLDPALRAPCDCDALPVYVHVASAASAASARDAQARLREAGFPDLSPHDGGSAGYLAGKVPTDRLDAFAQAAGNDPDVTFVESGRGARLMNVNAMRILQSGTYTGATPVWAAGVYGSNQVIAVLDTGLDIDHCHFRDTIGELPPTNRVDGTNVNLALRKVIAADFLYAGDDPSVATHWDNQNHGTHVSAHALASDLAAPLSNHIQNGMAPAAKLVVQDGGYTVDDNCADLVGLGCPVTNFLPALRQAYLQGARLHNNSWGDNENGVFTNLNAYTQASRDVDAVTWSNRDFLVVCAAGNAGGPFDRVSSPSTAKNGLSVAASGNGSGQESMAGFSSRGWTQDGRIKPDLAAPGDNVNGALSDKHIATSNCTTTGGGGTSYASPLVAGLGALVREYFAAGFHPGGSPAASNAMPYVSAALVKATLINACVALNNATSPPPARDQGWGRPNLARALAFTNSAHRLRAWDEPLAFAAAPALPFVRYLDVKGTGAPLKVTLAWSDFPGTPGAAKQLVNDLDLVVRTPTAGFRGNVFSNGWSVGGGGSDRTNNVEQVAWQVPATGLVEISVWAHVVPEATQYFALVVSGVFEEAPLSTDEDADGLPDVWEHWHFGDLDSTSATNDYDGDGVADGDEYAAGTQPTNDLSYLAIVGAQRTEDDAVALDVPVVSGRRYTVQFADAAGDDAQFGAFANEAEGVGRHTAGAPGSNGVFRFIDNFTATNSGGPDATGRRIYRVRAEGPP